ncbi:MAG: glycosyltransferase [Bacteroidales bacterium]|nr:glycosyltransferase [Bacteroidales bacterium]
MIKVLRIINRFNLGGPTYNTSYLTKYLSADYETLLVGGMKDESEASSEYILENIGIQPLIISEMRRSVNPFQDVSAYFKIKKIIKEFKPDIVHTHASKAGFVGRLAAHHCKVPVIIHTFHGHVFHSYFNKYITWVFKTIERYMARISTKIIAISDIQKEELTKIHAICNASKVAVVPLGFDVSRFSENVVQKEKFRKTYNISDDEIAIGIIGRLVPIKNHSLFIDAIKFVSAKTSKKIRAFIIGDGESRLTIENYATQCGIEFTVENTENLSSILHFTSWIKEIDSATLGLDIIALTSLNEGTPVSLIEAQASNKPIVSTRVGGIENVVLEGKTALLSDLSNPELFFNNLLQLIEDDNLRNTMSVNASEFVRERFGYKTLVNNIEILYKSLLS